MARRVSASRISRCRPPPYWRLSRARVRAERGDPLAKVTLPAGLRRLTAGVESVQVEASTVRQLILELDRLYPGMGAQLRSGMAVAIDGEIIQEPLLETLQPTSEV